ncbi:MAG: hypothetical protein HYW48_09455 [Deltaproteobacteria bacterium]|nr:hypothetical protein [Deltaproteobacteria bacterium]
MNENHTTRINYIQGRLGIIGVGFELGVVRMDRQYFALIEQEALPLVGDFFNILAGTKFSLSESFLLKVAAGYHYDPAISGDKSGLILSAMTTWQFHNDLNMSLEFLGGALTLYPRERAGYVFPHIPKVTFNYELD